MTFFNPEKCVERSHEAGEQRNWSDVIETQLCERFERLAQFVMAQQRQASAGCQLTCYLMGPLGAGKSTAARALIRRFGVSGPIKSPTYALLEPYTVQIPSGECESALDEPSFFVGHWDLYRVSDPDEIEHLGFRDYLAQPGLQIIEWPQQGVGYLPWPDLAFDIQLTLNESAMQLGGVQLRQVFAYAFSPQGQACLSAMDDIAQNEGAPNITPPE